MGHTNSGVARRRQGPVCKLLQMRRTYGVARFTRDWFYREQMVTESTVLNLEWYILQQRSTSFAFAVVFHLQ